MKNIPLDPEGGCPVKTTVAIIGGRWKPMILHHLMGGTKRFNEFRRLLPDVTQRMLTLQLRELEEAGIVSRKIYAQVPPKVEYSLTPLGRTLEPVVAQMGLWGQQYIANREQAESEHTSRTLAQPSASTYK